MSQGDNAEIVIGKTCMAILLVRTFIFKITFEDMHFGILIRIGHGSFKNKNHLTIVTVRSVPARFMSNLLYVPYQSDYTLSACPMIGLSPIIGLALSV